MIEHLSFHLLSVPRHAGRSYFKQNGRQLAEGARGPPAPVAAPPRSKTETRVTVLVETTSDHRPYRSRRRFFFPREAFRDTACCNSTDEPPCSRQTCPLTRAGGNRVCKVIGSSLLLAVLIRPARREILQAMRSEVMFCIS